MHKGYVFSKYALDKDLKDIGGLWSRIDFRDYIITPKKVWLINRWFQAGCFLQQPAKGIKRRKKYVRLKGGGRIGLTISARMRPAWFIIMEALLCSGTGRLHTVWHRFIQER